MTLSKSDKNSFLHSKTKFLADAKILLHFFDHNLNVNSSQVESYFRMKKQKLQQSVTLILQHNMSINGLRRKLIFGSNLCERTSDKLF